MNTSGFPVPPAAVARVSAAVRPDRLLRMAERLLAVPSPTGNAGQAADELATLLREQGLAVERHDAAHPAAPAVVARLAAAPGGRTLQFNGHLDTVHLPFVPPGIVGERLTGSGAADMKAGLAAAVQAVLAVRDSGLLRQGGILLTGHDLHEAPWGNGRQIDALIALGVHGDAVLIPEYFNTALAVVGRGLFTWTITIRRPGPPIHEVFRPAEPGVIRAGADLGRRLHDLDARLAVEHDPFAGPASIFVGTVQSGSIYNEFPQSFRAEDTRRWLPGTCFATADAELRGVCDAFSRECGLAVDVETRPVREGFRLDPAHPFSGCFQGAHEMLSGHRLPLGGKPFVDDGNTFWSAAGVSHAEPATTVRNPYRPDAACRACSAVSVPASQCARISAYASPCSAEPSTWPSVFRPNSLSVSSGQCVKCEKAR